MDSSINPLPSTSNSSQNLDSIITRTTRISAQRKSKEQQRKETQIMCNPTKDELKQYATLPNEETFDITKPIPFDSNIFKLQYPAKSAYAYTKTKKKNLKNDKTNNSKQNLKKNPTTSKPKRVQPTRIFKKYRYNQRMESNQLVFHTAYLENENQALKIQLDKLQMDMLTFHTCGQIHDERNQHQQQQPSQEGQQQNGKSGGPGRMILLKPKPKV